ncbi:hypothetical protein K466DRAFT_567140 [Polyporus arcularius HHB13444]|uniref:Uncharacterized protein n=1 Tax=Polyporus arcularius HHB13444 TaxID=1314778 RepID=A0A5C3P6R3_9APHY|nr:hypothetical protein K466DRAFT_567140 [Polyporus arcularius HHB13444]
MYAVIMLCARVNSAHNAIMPGTTTKPNNSSALLSAEAARWVHVEASSPWSRASSGVVARADFRRVDLSTTHPSIYGPPTSFIVPPGRPSSTASTPVTLPPPIAAFDGVRELDSGTTADRWHSAIVITTPTSGRTVPTQNSTSARPGSQPAAQSTSDSSDSNYQTFSVCFWPFVHPAFGRTRSKFPRRSFHFTDWSFGKAVESLEHWGLLFTVNLAKTGSVYRSLGNQVVAHLTANDILLPGYDPRRAWRSPLDLPFVLLSSSGRTTRVHAPYDSLNELTYTVPNILSAKPSLTVIKCPIGEEFMKHELLRLAPRFGDLQAPLANHPAYVLGAPGLHDFMSIRGAELPHPCFPFRVLSEALEDLSAECRPDCPSSSSPSSPALAPVAGPSSRPLPRPARRDTRAGGAPPPPLSAPSPMVPPPPTSVLDQYLNDDRPPTPPTPQSPASFLRAGCPLTPDIPAMSLLDTDIAMLPAGEASALRPAVSPVVAVPHTERSAPRRSARMSTGGRPPARLPRPAGSPPPETTASGSEYQPSRASTPSELVSAADGTSSTRGIRRAHSEVGSPQSPAAMPPSNRRRVSSPDPPEALSPSSLDLATGSSADPHVPVHPPCRTAPLREFTKAELGSWADRVVAAIPRGAPSSAGLRPKIRGRDAKEVASMLLFLIQWLFTHSPHGPITTEKRRAFQEAFSREFSGPGAYCELVPLPEILRHIRHLDIEIDHGIGDSPMRAVMRHLVQLVPEHYGTEPLSPEDLDAIEQALVSSLVFGGRQVADDPDMHAFMDGVFAAHPQRRALIATFEGLARDYIAAMCNKRLDNVQFLLDHIRFATGVDHSLVDLTGDSGMTVAEWDQIFEREFQEAFGYYIRQAGHPDDNEIRKLVGESFDSATGDRLLRARMFLAIMSGSDLVPIEKEWSIKVAFQHKGTRCPDPPPERGALGPIPAAIDIRACFYECTVIMDDALPQLSPLPPMDSGSSADMTLLNVRDNIRALRLHVLSFARVVDYIDDPWVAAACVDLVDRLDASMRAIDLELDYVRQMQHCPPSPSQDPCTDILQSEPSIPPELETSSDEDTEDYPDANEGILDPPWIDWFWGESDEDPWLWRPLGLIEAEEEPEWPPRDLLELEEAMETSPDDPSLPWYASQALLEDYLQDLAQNQPNDMLF